MTKTKITMASQIADYSQWYLDVAHQGDMFEYAPVTGCITFLPKAVTLWSQIREVMTVKMKALGVQDIMLPLLIPVSFFEREKDHIEGFAPEFATVTHVGGKELPEHYAIRPTSETLFCDFFKKQLQSYKDLPMLYNQWANVMRWEKRPRPFLRTSEFHWQEGHTLHITEDEAREFALQILQKMYVETIREFLAIDGLEGEKSPSERFPGALHTYTYESMMSNGWSLQSCTSHLLSQNFMKEFEVSYQDNNGKQAYPFYTSWGASTRLLGAIISSHSDDRGLVIPPRMSEYRATLLPLYMGDKAVIDAYSDTIAETLL
ncbi:MAG: aminoacyl--tRNA ligase-related protein [bacterium]